LRKTGTLDALEPRATLSSILKSHLRRYSRARYLYANAVYFSYALREGLWRNLVRFSRRSDYSGSQEVISWDVPFSQMEDPGELGRWLQAQGIHFEEGHNTIYLPPQEKLRDLVPAVVEFYPPNTGFKILKDFRPPEEANYLSGNHLFVRAKLAGKPQDQLVTANYMYSLGLGPRVWDVCCWKGGSRSYTVFAVDHVIGEAPTSGQCMEFVERLRKITQDSYLRILIPDWEQNPEFQYPDCNQNLVQNEGGYPQYIDFQNFRITHSSAWSKDIIAQAKDVFHFGGGRPLRTVRYLYQSIPGTPNAGKRNTSKRWAFIRRQLSEAGLEIRGRLAIDIGCNAGMILHSALMAGAMWGLGWDRPSIVRYAESLLFSLGSSRFHLMGAELDPMYPLEQDIAPHLHTSLREAVVFYLAVREHLGLLHSLQRIPWRILVYEGHQRENLEEVLTLLRSLLNSDIDCITSAYISDGDCGVRPFAILLRR
jgi:hypothetical protein